MKKIYGVDLSNHLESIPEELIEDGNKAKKRDSKYRISKPIFFLLFFSKIEVFLSFGRKMGSIGGSFYGV